MSSSTRLTIAISTVAIAAIIFASCLLVWSPQSIDLLGIEGYKAALQFVLIAILGGALSLLYQAFNRDAENRTRKRNEIDEHRHAIRKQRQSFTASFINDYNSIKRARRLLRARALNRHDGRETLRITEYDLLMADVIEAQLKFETTKYALLSDTTLFPDSDAIIKGLSQIESYLATLITEYENALPQMSPSGQETDLTNLPHLAHFLGSYRQSKKFRDEFVHGFHSALRVLQESTAAHIDA